MVAFKAMDIIDANSVPVFKLCVYRYTSLLLIFMDNGTLNVLFNLFLYLPVFLPPAAVHVLYLCDKNHEHFQLPHNSAK